MAMKSIANELQKDANAVAKQALSTANKYVDKFTKSKQQQKHSANNNNNAHNNRRNDSKNVNNNNQNTDHRRRQYGQPRNSLNQPSGGRTRGGRFAQHTSFTTKNDSLILNRRECLGSINASVAFEVQKNYLVSPTNTSLFKWGSQLGVLFEQFELMDLRVHFKTSAGMTTGTQQQGTLYMVMVYDADDNMPTTQVTFEDYDGCVSTPTYRDKTFRMHEGSLLFKKLYVQHSGDVDLNAPGRLLIAVQGQPTDDVVIGEVWIDYTIRLQIPRASAYSLFSTRAQVITTRVVGGFAGVWAGSASLDATASAGWPLAVVGLDNLNKRLYLHFSNTGRYNVYVSAYSSNNGHGGSLTTSFTGTTVAGLAGNLDSKSSGATAGATGSTWVSSFTFDATQVNNSNITEFFTFSNTADGTVIWCDISISAIATISSDTSGTPVISSSAPPVQEQLKELYKELDKLRNPPAKLEIRIPETNESTPGDDCYILSPVNDNTSSSSSSGSYLGASAAATPLKPQIPHPFPSSTKRS